jgi:hypothetical protein
LIFSVFGLYVESTMVTPPRAAAASELNAGVGPFAGAFNPEQPAVASDTIAKSTIRPKRALFEEICSMTKALVAKSGDDPIFPKTSHCACL